MYRLTGFVLYSWQHYWREIFFTVPAYISRWIKLNRITSLWIKISINPTLQPNHTGPHWLSLWTVLFFCVMQKKSSQVRTLRSRRRNEDGLLIFVIFLRCVYLCVDWSRAPALAPAPAPAPSTAIQRRPTASSWPGTSEASSDRLGLTRSSALQLSV